MKKVGIEKIQIFINKIKKKTKRRDKSHNF